MKKESLWREQIVFTWKDKGKAGNNILVQSLFFIFRSASNGWFKLKPSASKDCDLDLALVAVHPGAGRNGKTLYRFAAFDEKTQDYKLCLSCSYGLSDTVREAIRFEYGQLLEEAPEELTFYGKRPKNIARGDGGYIDFERWQVIKITSNGVRNGKLVDPVMREWRLDKPVEQVNTWEEFSDYATARVKF